MSMYSKLATEAGEQYLAALAEAQDKFVKSMSAVTSSMPPMTAYSDTFPTPQEINEINYTFASKLLKQQKEFVEKVISAGTPATS